MARSLQLDIPLLLPDVAELADISVEFATSPNHDDGFWPYLRDPVTLARPWAVPGTPKLMHRIGGIEKEDGSGNISYQPENHERMVRLRQAKVDGISADIPLIEVDHQDGAELLVIGWGSTWGAIKAGVRRVRAGGQAIAQAHIHHLNPLPANIGEVLARYPKVLCPEMNLGQLSQLLRGKFLVDVQSFTKVTGVPFRAAEMEARMLEEIAR